VGWEGVGWVQYGVDEGGGFGGEVLVLDVYEC
jgi:hypothetical protein